jgi:nicotinamidase-related amidase
MTRRDCLTAGGSLLLGFVGRAQDGRPKREGTLLLHARGRGLAGVQQRELTYNIAETAIIICDMWDNHYCQNAAKRVGAMAVRMNQVVGAARQNGVQIIHAPSGTMDVYAGSPYRLRMMRAPKVTPPVPILSTCPLDRVREDSLPIDDVTEPCDDQVVGPAVRRYNRENEALEITGYDGISDSGQEIYNFCVQEGIRNIVLMGVHTNMCVLGRSFGIRQQVRLGMNVVLARDLTDAMYDPRQKPFVSHQRGTELVIEHIERFWCPSILSDDLTTSNHYRSDRRKPPSRP